MVVERVVVAMRCPRRDENPMDDVSNYPKTDKWTVSRGVLSCSYCGSMHPDEFLDAWEAGGEVGPTDKNYKAYFETEGIANAKLYFQHFDDGQKHRFIDILNAVPRANKRVDVGDEYVFEPVDGPRIGYPGHFYNPPFFVRLV